MSILTRTPAKRLISEKAFKFACIAFRSIAQEPKHEIDEKFLQVPQHYDIIIAGGGLVGTALSCSFAKSKILSQKKILLLERAPPFKGFSGAQYGNRVSALSQGSVDLFKQIGAWDHIYKTRCKTVKQMQVWDACSDALVMFNHKNFADNVAYIVENDLILDALYAQLKTAENVTILNRSVIEMAELRSFGNQKNTVLLKGGNPLTCDLLIGADGINSIIRKEMAVDVYEIDYESRGIVATLNLVDPGDNSVAWQRFLPSGPVALLPLNDTMSSLVWSTSPKEAERLLKLPPNEFVDELNEAFWKDIQKSSFVSSALKCVNSVLKAEILNRQYPPKIKSIVEDSRASFPLGLLHASSYVSTGVALVGDAAHRVHPLAGQGVNLGFSDIKILTKSVCDALYSGADIGDKSFLLQYEQSSLVRNVPLLLGIHGLQRLYSTTFSPVVFFRSLGLQLTQNIPFLKQLFMNRAMA